MHEFCRDYRLRPREAIKDALKITDVVSALAAIERIVYMGISK